jgi:hypothetical protein
MKPLKPLLLVLCLLSSTTATRAESRPILEFASDTDYPVEIKLNGGEIITRYQLSTNDGGDIVNNTDQERVVFDVTVSFFKGKVRFDFTGTSGSTFAGSFGSTGLGSSDPNLAFYLRRLSMTLTPKSGLELSLGSLTPEFGAGTENSYLDADGYIMGYRARASILKGQLVVTGGYLGDFKDPSVFNRLDRLDDFNYLQIVLTQTIGELVRASLEYNQIDGQNYARGALNFDVSKWAKFLDSILTEDMIRLSSENPANLLAVTLSKRFKDVFGGALPGRDLQTSLTYAFMTENLDLPIGDHVFEGHSVRLRLAIPNLVKFGSTSLGLFTDYTQSFSDFDHFRAEAGLILKF